MDLGCEGGGSFPLDVTPWTVCLTATAEPDPPEHHCLDIEAALYLAQTGKRPDSTKVLRGFGDASVLEVIESQAGNAYRAVYTVRFAAAVIVLHVFQKKSKSGIETPKPDMDLIEARLKKAAELMKVSKS